MLSDEAFHVIMCVFRFVVWIIWGDGAGMLGSGGGWEYSTSVSLHFNDSLSKFSGKKENLFVIIWIVSGMLLCLMKSYSFLCMLLGGLMRS